MVQVGEEAGRSRGGRVGRGEEWRGRKGELRDQTFFNPLPPSPRATLLFMQVVLTNPPNCAGYFNNVQLQATGFNRSYIFTADDAPAA